MEERSSSTAPARPNGDGLFPPDAEAAGSFTTPSRLHALGQIVPPLEIAELWVFPPLEDVDQSAEFFLFTRFLDGEQRTLYSARMVPANGSPARQIVVEHGSVPADRVPRLVGQLERRLGRHHPPRHIAVRGKADIWEALLAPADDSD